MASTGPETALQRETRLTGSAELIAAVDATIQAFSAQKSNSVLARKVLGRWCQSSNAQIFVKKARDYLGNIDDSVLLGFYMTLQKRVEQLDASADSKCSTEELAGNDEVQEGGLLKHGNKISFRPRHSALGLDKIAKLKKQEREKEAPALGKRMALSADPLADAPKPKMILGVHPTAPKEEDARSSDSDSGPLGNTKKQKRKGQRSRSRSASRSPARRREKASTGASKGGRATSSDLWAAAKQLREQKEMPPPAKKERVGEPVFFKGNKSAKTNDEIKKEADSVKVKLENKDLDYSGLTDEILTKDDVLRKIATEAEIDQFEEDKLDRTWYDAEEEGCGNNVVEAEEDPAKLAEKEEKVKKMAASAQGRMSIRQRQKNETDEKWQLNRLNQAGLAERKELDLVYDDDDDKRVVLHVRDTVPPFLDGRFQYTQQSEPVSSVKDPTSDMAVLAKNGSKVLKATQEDQDRTKFRARFWEVSGSNMGKVLGVKEKDKEAADDDVEEDDYNFKAGAQYGDALKKQKTVAESEFAKTKTLDQQRKSLPVYHVKDQIMDLLREHSIIVCVGETGSGKTTQLTQYLHEYGYTVNGQIGCTQPRRVAAVSVAKRVSEERNVELGKQVGYAIRFEDVTSDETIIKYMTDGVLLRETLLEPDLDKYCAIIMDEAHERSLNTDVLFGVLRQVVARRNDFKLIVTSATMDSAKFANFFGGVPVFNIPGRTFSVETLYARTTAQDYVDEAVQQALAIHVGQDEGDILIFMTGQADIETTCVLLADRLTQVGENVAPLTILPIYSQLPSDMQAKIFEHSDKRKIIVATNIAETSLTVDGIKYVIDTGYCKLKMYNPKMGMDSLQVTPVSQANANQRRGRAGRTGPGKCWRLYTENAFFSELLTMTIPEIQRTNLSNVVLLLKSMGIKNLLEFGFMDPPPQDTILNSMFQLWMLGALDNLGDITPLGSKMSQFPLDPPLSKMMIVAEELGCSSEVMTVVSVLSVPSIFFRPKDRVEESDAAREKFFCPESDHLSLLNVYQQWVANGYSAKWCTEHFVHQKSLKKVREVRGQLEEIMTQQKLQINTCGTDWDTVRRAIAAGYFHNAAKQRGIGEYVNLRSKMPAHLHPTSALYGLGYTPDYIVYHEVVLTVKEYMSTVTAVDAYWLAELGPMFFSVSETGSDIHTKKRQQAEEQRQMEYQQKLRDDLDRQAKQEEAEALLVGGKKATDVGGKRAPKDPKSSPLSSPLSMEDDAGGSDSDGAAKRRRKAAKAGGPRRKMMVL